jgi:hypothetical protein
MYLQTCKVSNGIKIISFHYKASFYLHVAYNCKAQQNSMLCASITILRRWYHLLPKFIDKLLQIHTLDPNFTHSKVASRILLSIHVSTYAPQMRMFLRWQFPQRQRREWFLCMMRRSFSPTIFKIEDVFNFVTSPPLSSPTIPFLNCHWTLQLQSMSNFLQTTKIS